MVGPLLPDVAARPRAAPDVPVVAVGSHDTASAVVGVPAADDARSPTSPRAPGRWSASSSTQPVLTEEARVADFTNEVGVDGTVRYLQQRDGPVGALGVRCAPGATDGSPDATCARCSTPRPTRQPLRHRDRHRRPAAAAAGRHAGPDRRARRPREPASRCPQSPAAITRCIARQPRAGLPPPRAARRPRSPARPSTWCTSSAAARRTQLLCQLTADACGLPGAGRAGRGRRARQRAGPGAGARRRPARPGRDAGAGARVPTTCAATSRAATSTGPPVDARHRATKEDDRMRVALMVTCVNDALFPDTGKAVVRLLRRLGVDVEFPAAQTCCAPADGQHRLPRRGGAGRAHLRRRVRRLRRDRHAVGLVRGVGAPPARRSSPARSGDAGAGRGGRGDVAHGPTS